MSVPLFKRLSSRDTALMKQLNQVFAAAFNEPETYRPLPSDSYIEKLLAKDHIVVLVALMENRVVGGLVAYILEKFEQERSEAYIYDLAVDEAFRRRGIARGLINTLKGITRRAGSWVIFVQADRTDTPAVKLYESMGEKEEPLHFDIPVA